MSYYFKELDADIVALDALIFGEVTPIEIWRSKRGLRLCVAMYNGVMVGFIAFYIYSDRVIHVWKTGVLPNYRSGGLFGKLLAIVLSVGKSWVWMLQ